ncbi:MAG: hypothetical protein QOH78_736 [Verrucomicrobiota bacterium]
MPVQQEFRSSGVQEFRSSGVQPAALSTSASFLRQETLRTMKLTATTTSTHPLFQCAENQRCIVPAEAKRIV